MSGESSGGSRAQLPLGVHVLAPLRNVPFALFIIVILAYGAAFAWYTLERFDLVNLIRDGYYDDAFYYLQIAYHMAEGRFSTFDGGITRTNGYHPLWLFLITPFYWVFDKTEALFAIKAFEIMLVAGGVALVAAAMRVSRLPWILLFAALPALYVQNGLLWGLEAALGLFMLGLLLLAVCLFWREPTRWRWLLATVLFALPWARLEYMAVALAVAAALCFLEWSGRLPCATGSATSGSSKMVWARADARRWRLRSAVPLAAAVAGVLVYFAYNGVVFGGIVPVSGATKVAWAAERWRYEGGHSLAESFHALAHSHRFDDELPIALEICAYALLVWLLPLRDRIGAGTLLAFMVGAFGLAAGHLAKFAQSVLFLHPVIGQDAWHFVPAYLMKGLVGPLRCFVGIHVLRFILGRRLPRAADALGLAAIVVAGVVLLAKADFAKPFELVDTHRESRAQGPMVLWYMGAAVSNRLLPKDTLIGAWNSGVLGYFSKIPVVNLDGLANSYDYYKDATVRRQRGDHRFGLSYVGDVYRETDGPSEAGSSLSSTEDATPVHGLVFQTHLTARDLRYMSSGPSRRRQFRLYRLSRDERPIRFLERMAPHLERQADGTGLLAQGRVAQAFAAACGTNEVAEWTFGGKVGLVSTWTRTADGSCASAVVLPHGHLPPLRVRRAALDEAVAGLVGKRPPAIKAAADDARGFDVHLVGKRLLYVKEVCEQADIETPFFLDMVQAGDDSKEVGLVDWLTFPLEDYGNWADGGKHGGEAGHCFAEAPLPNVEAAVIRTGQYTADRYVWHGVVPLDLARSPDGVGLLWRDGTAQAFAMECAAHEVAAWTFGGRVGLVSAWMRKADGSCRSVVPLPHGHLRPVGVRRAALGDAVADRTGGQPPAIRADFDVYLVEDALVYAKEACEQVDVETPFFLHLVPAGDDFEDGWESVGFNNADFWLAHRGSWSGENGSPCLAEVPLPRYDIATIRTGQYTPHGRVWEGEIRFDQPGRVRRTPLDEAVADLVGERLPAIRADSRYRQDAPQPRGFDVYLAEDTLVYVKAACEQADVETPFFLHLVPVGDDFDEGREASGFNNADFMFMRYGKWSGVDGSTCLAEVPLPEYGVAEIRTGQYSASDSRRLWEGRIASRGQPTTEGA